MNVTVTTDASFSKKYNFGSYAFWITSNLGRIQRSGVLRDSLADSSQAEMKAICNALFFIFKHQEELYMKATNIYINTDSMNSIHLFTGDKKMIRKYHLLNRKSDKKIFEKFIYIEKLYHLRNKKIIFRHIKAHDGTATPDKYVHDWADQAAKAALQTKLNKLKFKNHDSHIHNENSIVNSTTKLPVGPDLPAKESA